MSPEAIICLDGVTKSYPRPSSTPFLALSDVSLQVTPHTFVAILGKSGSGKSTLLNLLAGLDRPTSGTITVAGTSLTSLSEDGLAAWRGRTVGVVFQFFQLLPTLTVLENILLAMDFLRTVPRQERRQRAEHLLELVGIADQAGKLPATLSGGQQQRAAIARALANDPPILVADEPTGNLDSRTAHTILDLFAELVHRGKMLVVVTHDEDLAAQAQHRVHLADGKVADDLRIPAGGVR